MVSNKDLAERPEECLTAAMEPVWRLKRPACVSPKHAPLLAQIRPMASSLPSRGKPTPATCASWCNDYIVDEGLKIEVRIAFRCTINAEMIVFLQPESALGRKHSVSRDRI